MAGMLTLVWFGLSLAHAAADQNRPNVLFIAVDDLKPAIGCYGDANAKTPNIDKLGVRGVIFERAYCMQAVCSPSRNGVLTGLRPRTLRIHDLATNFRKRAPDVITLPQHFKNHGYHTEALGKIFHVGHGNHEDPASWSVPHWSAKSIGYALPENRVTLTREEARFANKELKRADQLPRGAAYEAADVPDNTYGDGKIADEAILRLRAAKGRPNTPFFLAVGFLKPHLPFCAPKKYWDLHDPATLPMPTRHAPPAGAPPFAPQAGGELRQYAGMPKTGPIDEASTRSLIHGYYAAASYMDAQLGRVLDALDQLGLASNTIVVLWGDHGWHLGDHGIWCKHTNYEQATRAPLLIAAPGIAPRRTAALVEFVDIYPTLVELADLPKPSHLQGDSLAALLKSEAEAAKPAFAAAFQVYPRSSKETGPLLGQAARSDRFRYVEWRDSKGATVARELYDLRDDPGETENLASRAEFAKVVKNHERLVAEQLAQADPPGLRLLPLGGAATPTDATPKKNKPANKTDRVALFKRKDSDGDGMLTRAEFLANQPDPNEAPARFEKFDANKNGELSEEEFVTQGRP